MIKKVFSCIIRIILDYKSS